MFMYMYMYNIKFIHYSITIQSVTDSVRALVMAIRDKCPGQTECDAAIDTLNDTITQVDQAILAVVSHTLQPNASTSLQVCNTLLHVTCTCIHVIRIPKI